MRVLVCGTRYNNIPLFEMMITRLNELKPSLIIEGGAKGVDSAAWAYASNRGLSNITEPADWKTHGRAAGPIRNQKMLDDHKPDLVLAFHTDPGLGKGTADMVRRARKAGVPVEVHVLEEK